MLKNNLKSILLFSVLVLTSFLISCSQKSVAMVRLEPTIKSTPPLISANAVSKIDDKKYYSPSDTCQKKSSNAEKNLCLAIIEDQDLSDQLLSTEFAYADRHLDLNKDGNKEVIVWIPNSDLGGTSGYPIIIFSETQNGFQKLWEDQAWTPIIVLPAKTNGWQDVAFQVAGGGVQPHYEILRYNGKIYQSSKTQKNQPKGELILDKNWKQSVFGPIPN